MINYQTRLIRINGIAGMHYFTKKPTQTLVIYGLGAPVVPDNGTLPDAPYIMQYACDLLIPDYIGYGRSNGAFTPKNCIKTFLTIYKKFKLKYHRIIFIGRSLGGTYIPILPLFQKNITELGLIFPAVDNPSCGSIKGEETNEDFIKDLQNDQFKPLYRRVNLKEWWNHLLGEDGLSPMDNILCLKNVRLFIIHGKKDKLINYSKSQKYFDKIIKQFPDKKSNFHFKLYENGEHDQTTSNKACQDILDWFKVQKRH